MSHSDWRKSLTQNLKSVFSTRQGDRRRWPEYTATVTLIATLLLTFQNCGKGFQAPGISDLVQGSASGPLQVNCLASDGGATCAASSTIPLTSYAWWLNGVQHNSCSGSVACAVTGLSPGTYAIQARGVSLDGAPISSPLANFTVQAPAINITCPTPVSIGASVTCLASSANSSVLTGLIWKKDNVQVATCSTSSCVVTTNAATTFNVQAESANHASQSNTVVVVVSTTQGGAGLVLSCPPTSQAPLRCSVAVTGTITNIRLYEGTSNRATCVTSGASGTTCEWASPPLGSHTLLVRGTNTANSQTISSATVSVTIEDGSGGSSLAIVCPASAFEGINVTCTSTGGVTNWQVNGADTACRNTTGAPATCEFNLNAGAMTIVGTSGSGAGAMSSPEKVITVTGAHFASHSCAQTGAGVVLCTANIEGALASLKLYEGPTLTNATCSANASLTQATCQLQGVANGPHTYTMSAIRPKANNAPTTSTAATVTVTDGTGGSGAVLSLACQKAGVACSTGAFTIAAGDTLTFTASSTGSVAVPEASVRWYVDIGSQRITLTACNGQFANCAFKPADHLAGFSYSVTVSGAGPMSTTVTSNPFVFYVASSGPRVVIRGCWASVNSQLAPGTGTTTFPVTTYADANIICSADVSGSPDLSSSIRWYVHGPTGRQLFSIAGNTGCAVGSLDCRANNVNAGSFTISAGLTMTSGPEAATSAPVVVNFNGISVYCHNPANSEEILKTDFAATAAVKCGYSLGGATFTNWTGKTPVAGSCANQECDFLAPPANGSITIRASAALAGGGVATSKSIVISSPSTPTVEITCTKDGTAPLVANQAGTCRAKLTGGQPTGTWRWWHSYNNAPFEPYPVAEGTCQTPECMVDIPDVPAGDFKVKANINLAGGGVAEQIITFTVPGISVECSDSGSGLASRTDLTATTGTVRCKALVGSPTTFNAWGGTLSPTTSSCNPLTGCNFRATSATSSVLATGSGGAASNSVSIHRVMITCTPSPLVANSSLDCTARLPSTLEGTISGWDWYLKASGQPAVKVNPSPMCAGNSSCVFHHDSAGAGTAYTLTAKTTVAGKVYEGELTADIIGITVSCMTVPPAGSPDLPGWSTAGFSVPAGTISVSCRYETGGSVSGAHWISADTTQCTTSSPCTVGLTSGSATARASVQVNGTPTNSNSLTITVSP